MATTYFVRALDRMADYTQMCSSNDGSTPLEKITFNSGSPVDPDDAMYKAIMNAPHNRSVMHTLLVQSRWVYVGPMGESKEIAIQNQSDSSILDQSPYILKLHRNVRKDVIHMLMLHHLHHHVYARVYKTNFGVGVMAIKDIPANVSVFDTMMSRCPKYLPIHISPTEAAALDPATREMLGDFFLGPRGEYPVPIMGPNTIDVSFYLNHSLLPNLDIRYLEGCDMSVYVTRQPVVKGQELTIDYRQFDIKNIQERMPFLGQ